MRSLFGPPVELVLPGRGDSIARALGYLKTSGTTCVFKGQFRDGEGAVVSSLREGSRAAS
jgi:hypothetical protein